MKKSIFIIAGAVIVVTLAFVWIYLLLNPSNSQGVFSNLGFGDEEDIGIVEPAPAEETPVVNIERPALRQLTTKPVAGFREINTATSSSIYYSEKGSGFIYSIDLTSGEEVRISGTTVPNVYTAAISPNGDYVAMGLKSNTKNTPLVLGKISDNLEIGLVLENFDMSVDKFAIQDDKELLYTSRGDRGLVGHSYNFKKETTKTIFELPFHEAVIQWGKQGSDTHYAYPKTSYLLEGYLYQIKNKEVSRLPADGFGFSGLVNRGIIAYTKFDNLKTKNFIYNRETGETSGVRIPFLPEKCIIGVINTLICAHEDIEPPIGYPDEWYKGSLSFKDSIWIISGDSLTTELLVNTRTESGREIDVTNLGIGDSETSVYFINKNDNTLWMYEL